MVEYEKLPVSVKSFGSLGGLWETVKMFLTPRWGQFEHDNSVAYNALLLARVLREQGVPIDVIDDAHVYVSQELSDLGRVTESNLNAALSEVGVTSEVCSIVFDALLNDPPNAPYGVILSF